MPLASLTRKHLPRRLAALIAVLAFSALAPAPHPAAQTAGSPSVSAAVPKPPGYDEIKPKSISVLSPSDATIEAGKSAVYRIEINPASAAGKYYVCLNYEHGGPDSHIQYQDSAGVSHPLPCTVLFDPGVTHVDATLVTDDKLTSDIYQIGVYQKDDVTTYQSAPLIVQNQSRQSATNEHLQGATNGQPIPISCTTPDAVQAGVEYLDGTAGINQLLTGGSPQAPANTTSDRKTRLTVIQVDCSQPDLYRPGKGLIANRALGSKGWPATLPFTQHRRQADFTIEPRPQTTVPVPGTVTLKFYAILKELGGLDKPKLCLIKNIPIIKPR